MIDETLLDRLPPLRGANAAARRELAARAVLRRFAAGEVLWLAGSAPRGLFVILEGRVRVVRSPGGRTHHVHVEGPGGTLGEVPLFDDGVTPASAIAAEATTCVVFGRDALHAAIAADPGLAFALLRRLSARVRQLVERLDRLAAQSVPARLAGLVLARHAAAAGGPFALGATQSEIAEELGTVREVVVRALRRLREDGTLGSAGRGRFRVLDERRLRALAEEWG
ncbi:MAG TPA: Crp/Fnr family transcriptional regulator [Longimicrobiales bacterium]|nr:Crp/Fnr family transcriptional regulator [Longimicrobiales bacterium]